MLTNTVKSPRLLKRCGSWIACLIGYHGDAGKEGQYCGPIGREHGRDWNVMVVSDWFILHYLLLKNLLLFLLWVLVYTVQCNVWFQSIGELDDGSWIKWFKSFLRVRIVVLKGTFRVPYNENKKYKNPQYKVHNKNTCLHITSHIISR